MHVVCTGEGKQRGESDKRVGVSGVHCWNVCEQSRKFELFAVSTRNKQRERISLLSDVCQRQCADRSRRKLCAVLGRKLRGLRCDQLFSVCGRVMEQ